MKQEDTIKENARILAERSIALESCQRNLHLEEENEKLKQEVQQLTQQLSEEKSHTEKYKTDMARWMNEAKTTQGKLQELRSKLEGLLGA